MKIPMRMLRALCWLSMTWLVSACGWQLQGIHRVPEYVAPLYLDLTDIHSPFAESLQQRLRQAGVTMTDDRSRARAVLRVTVDTSNHRVSSVSALNEPQQFQVYYEIEYRLDTHASDANAGSGNSGSMNLLPLQRLNSARTMSYDKKLALAKQREEMFLRETLATELTDQVMRLLSMLPSEPVPVTE